MKQIPARLQLPLVLTFLLSAFTFGVHTLRWPEKETSAPILRAEPNRAPVEQQARGVFQGFCSGCHQSGRAGIDFNDITLNVDEMRDDRAIWQEVVRRVQTGDMPPRNSPQPTEEQRASLIAWLEQEVLRTPAGTPAPRLLARRLQKIEYVNTMRDLLGVSIRPDAELPPDDLSWRPAADNPQISLDLTAQYRAIAEKALAPMNLRADAALNLVRVADGCDPEKVSAILAAFAQRAYRRPIEASELERLMAVFQQTQQDGQGTEESVQAVLLDLLTSPQFLLRTEANHADARPGDRDQFALASRLAFFLWRSTPDEELLAQAAQGTLVKNLDGQALRLLKDDRARDFAADFATRWLALDQVELMGRLDGPLGKAMRLETELFVAGIVADDRSVLEFLDSDYSFLNERLAQHYGIGGVTGDHLRRVRLPGGQRGGLVTHGSILTLTTPGADTSPVQRGKWILENLLGAPPVRPPADVRSGLASLPEETGPGAAKKRRAQHRSNPECFQCHVRMDALGETLENFDQQGAWRTETNRIPVDSSGVLENGKTLIGPRDLRAHLLEHREDFVRNLGQKLLQFSLGRNLKTTDRQALAQSAEKIAAGQNHFSAVVLKVVRSEPFLRGAAREPR